MFIVYPSRTIFKSKTLRLESIPKRFPLTRPRTLKTWRLFERNTKTTSTRNWWKTLCNSFLNLNPLSLIYHTITNGLDPKTGPFPFFHYLYSAFSVFLLNFRNNYLTVTPHSLSLLRFYCDSTVWTYWCVTTVVNPSRVETTDPFTTSGHGH